MLTSSTERKELKEMQTLLGYTQVPRLDIIANMPGHVQQTLQVCVCEREREQVEDMQPGAMNSNSVAPKGTKLRVHTYTLIQPSHTLYTARNYVLFRTMPQPKGNANVEF